MTTPTACLAAGVLVILALCGAAQEMNVCYPTEMVCGSGECLNAIAKCNGEKNCIDGSDETKEACDAPCPFQYFRCNNGSCIQGTWRCDGKSQCGDGSDERACGACDQGMFHCRNNRCIFGDWRCNGNNDCGDNSDETAAACSACDPGIFRCKNKECHSAFWRCGQGASCSDQSDATDCSAPVVEVPVGRSVTASFRVQVRDRAMFSVCNATACSVVLAGRHPTTGRSAFWWGTGCPPDAGFLGFHRCQATGDRPPVGLGLIPEGTHKYGVERRPGQLAVWELGSPDDVGVVSVPALFGDWVRVRPMMWFNGFSVDFSGGHPEYEENHVEAVQT